MKIENASPVTVQKIQGNTVKCENLLNIFGRTKGAYKAFENTTVRDYLTDKEYYIGLSRNNYENPLSTIEFTTNGFILSNASNAYGVAFPVKCKPNTTYSFSLNKIVNGVDNGFGFGFYAKDGTFIGNTDGISRTNYTFTTPENCVLLTVVFIVNGSISNITLNEGSTALPYEPYFEGLKHSHFEKIVSAGKNLFNEFALSTPVELGKWDYILPQTGEIVRGTNTYTLTGEEPFTGGDIGTTGWGGTDTVGFYVYFKKDTPSYASTMQQPNPIHQSADWYCNKFTCYVLLYNCAARIGFMANTSYLAFRVPHSLLVEYGGDNSSSDVNKTAFKAWLADMYAKGDPVIISYEVMDEFKTTEKIDIPKKYIAYNGGTETIVQGEIDNSEYGALLNVDNRYDCGSTLFTAPIKKCVGKNLFNIEDMIYGVTYVEDGYWHPNKGFYDNQMNIRLESGKTYYISALTTTTNTEGVGSKLNISVLAGKGAKYLTGRRIATILLASLNPYTTKMKFTVPDDVTWVSISFFGSSIRYKDFMLNEGDTALPYEPYKEWYEY